MVQKISKGDDDRSLFGGFTPPAVRQTSVVFLWYYINQKAPALCSGGDNENYFVRILVMKSPLWCIRHIVCKDSANRVKCKINPLKID